MIAAGDTGVGTGGCTGGTFGPDWPGTSPSVSSFSFSPLSFDSVIFISTLPLLSLFFSFHLPRIRSYRFRSLLFIVI